MTQGDLGGLLALDSTTLSRWLRPLAVEVWITGRKGKDRREMLLRITPNGQYRVDRARRAWERAHQRLRSRLKKEHCSQLVDDLAEVAAAAKC